MGMAKNFVGVGVTGAAKNNQHSGVANIQE